MAQAIEEIEESKISAAILNHRTDTLEAREFSWLSQEIL
jgi:hypothetical protein